MKSIKLLLGSAVVLLHATAFAAKPVEPPPAAGPTLAVNRDLLTATGVTPGKTLFILGLGVDVVAQEPLMRQTDVTMPANEQGSFELRMATPASPRSLWLLVDVQSGRYALASPGGHLPAQMTFSANALKSNGLGELRQIEGEILYAEVVWIRAGVGAWRMVAGDGGRLDADGKADGRTRLSVDDMTPLADSPEHPKKIEKGDTVILFDPRTLGYLVIEVGK